MLDVTTSLVYVDWVRKPLVHGIDRYLQAPRSWDSLDRMGWHKIQQQHREVFRAVIHSLDRAIEKRVLAPHVARRIFDLWGRALFLSKERRNAALRFHEEHGSAPPWFLVISPTRSCNLKCTGCYANSEPETGQPEAKLPWDMLDRIMTEAEERWGVALFVFSGGEPLTYRSQGKDLLN